MKAEIQRKLNDIENVIKHMPFCEVRSTAWDLMNSIESLLSEKNIDVHMIEKMILELEKITNNSRLMQLRENNKSLKHQD